MTNISEDQIEEAKDMGYMICDKCAQSYIPAPGYQNYGHQCGEDGTQDKFIQ